eukprot:TRINITY_DN32178_c0_g1_i1.p1 TRINITY_DN32178_c0_g1~~TRINITY_DN32178_c0_g1_i1.p1  ORF type:complete len:362 (+),score=72.97 TRINITY_DN32178_c0_g1_i1:141-1226(+)
MGAKQLCCPVVNEDFLALELLHGDEVRAVAISEDGRRLATGAWDGKARVYGLPASTLLLELQHEDSVLAVAFDPVGSRLVTAGRDGLRGRMCVFDIETGQTLLKLVHADAVCTVSWQPGWCGPKAARRRSAAWRLPPLLVSGCVDGTLSVFDARNGASILKTPHRDALRAVAFRPGSGYGQDGGCGGNLQLATACSDCCLRIVELPSNDELACLKHPLSVLAASFSHCDGSHLASACMDMKVRLYHVDTLTLVHSVSLPSEVCDVTFCSNDPTLLAVACWDGAVRLFDASTASETAVAWADSAVWSVAFGPQTGHSDTNAGCWMAAGSSDGCVRVYDLGTENFPPQPPDKGEQVGKGRRSQ